MSVLTLETPEVLKKFVGKEIGVSDWLAVTQERINKFAEATEDRQWIHVDRERAKRESPFKTTIAHGFLTLSLISHLIKEEVESSAACGLPANIGLNGLPFL